MHLTKGRFKLDEPKANTVHVWAPEDQLELARTVFKNLCPTQGWLDYAMGVKWTFMSSLENAAGSIAPSSMSAISDAQKIKLS